MHASRGPRHPGRPTPCWRCRSGRNPERPRPTPPAGHQAAHHQWLPCGWGPGGPRRAAPGQGACAGGGLGRRRGCAARRSAAVVAEGGAARPVGVLQACSLPSAAPGSEQSGSRALAGKGVDVSGLCFASSHANECARRLRFNHGSKQTSRQAEAGGSQCPPPSAQPPPVLTPQVETLAQLGVQLLLFGLGRELSVAKLRPVLRPAVLGGSLQIAALSALGAGVGAALGGGAARGAFVGALLSMSSTGVVVKCLEASRTSGSAFGQLTIGTLVLQDVAVGLLFALTPAFAHVAAAGAGPTGGAAGLGARGAAAGGAGGAAVAGGAAAAHADGAAVARLAVALLLLRVLAKLVAVVAAAWAGARAVLPPALRLLMRCVGGPGMRARLSHALWLAGQAGPFGS
jgi:hypothetical protein